MGVLFLVASVAGVLSVAFLGILNDPDSLVSASANRDQIILGVVLVVTMSLAIAMIPAAFFPVLKQHGEGLALGYVAARIVEAVTVLPAAVNPLLLLALSAQYTAAGSPDAAYFETLRTLVLSHDDMGLPISTTAFCVSALILNALLYRSGLVPRFISVWGLAGGALYLVGNLLVMFDVFELSSVPGTAMAVPTGVNEMVLAVWLIVRGFSRPPAAAPRDARTAVGSVG